MHATRSWLAGPCPPEIANCLTTAAPIPLYMVQADTVVYDLLMRRHRLGATEVEQIEYTALNATSKAQQSIRPRLANIRADLEP